MSDNGSSRLDSVNKCASGMSMLISGARDFNAVTLPQHYQLFNGEKEVIDLINDRLNVAYHAYDSPMMNYQYGNAIKYLMRWSVKNGVEDLKKCRQYLDMMIEDLDGKTTSNR